MTGDFDFLQGSFDVMGLRLNDPFDPNSGWADMPATSAAVTLCGGAVSIDEMWFPTGRSFGLSLRLWDPASGTWTVRWLNSGGGGLQPAVRGRWHDDGCWFTGPELYRGRDIIVSYSWSEVSSAGARWEQCFSVDHGRSWQPNWIMHFRRRADVVDHRDLPRVVDDFDFLRGPWNVHHHRTVDPVGQATGHSSQTVDFDGTHTGCSFFAGAVSVDAITLAGPGRYGLSFRIFDPEARQWTIHWVNSDAGKLEPPVRGAFIDGVGTFHGVEQIAGHRVEIRFIWSDITPTAARWRQSFRVEGGRWDDNWEMTFTRSTPEVLS